MGSHKKASYRCALLVLLIMGAVVVGCQANPRVTPTSASMRPTPSAETQASTTREGDAGQSAPDFTLNTVDGAAVSLRDYRGNVVMLNFWASWCPACRSEMSAINTYYEAHKDEGFVVIGINLGEETQAVNKFMTTTSLSFPIVMDHDGEVADLYGVLGLPTSFFVSRTGEIVGYWSGELTLEMLEMGIPPLMEK